MRAELWDLFADEDDIAQAPPVMVTDGRPPVTFPAEILHVLVKIWLGPLGWVDISPYVQFENQVVIQRGLRPDQRRTNVAQCSMVLRNDDKRFSQRNVDGPYFGYLRQNTPITVSVNPGSGDNLRLTGKVPNWGVRLGGHPNDNRVQVTAFGRRNSSELGDEPLQSAQYRYLSAQDTLQYRPIENDNFYGTLVDGPPGSDRAPDLAAGGVFSDSPPATAASSWRFEIDGRYPLDKGTADTAPLINIFAEGTVGLFRLSASSTVINLITYAQATGTPTGHNSATDAYDGAWHLWRFDAAQNGASVDLTVWLDNAVIISTSYAGTLGRPVFWRCQEDQVGADVERMPAFVHVVAYAPIPADPAGDDAYAAFLGHAGETPTERFDRLLTEEGVPHVVAELVTDGQRMGPQGMQVLSDLLEECESTAEGLIDETFADELRLSSRSHWINQALAMTLDCAATPSQVLGPAEPTDTTALTRNDWTITRDGGVTARERKEFGPLNVQDPMDDDQGIGPIKDSETLSLHVDDQALQHATYRVARDTVDEPSMPDTRFSLANAPSLISMWLGCDVGSRVLMANPPADAGPDDLDQILWGYVETITQVSWDVVAYLASGSIFQQALYGSFWPRYDCAGTTLAEVLDTTETGVDVTIADTCAWAHDDGDYQIVIGGEVLTVTAVSAVGGSHPARTQTLTVTRSINGTVATHAVGDEVHVLYPARYAL